MVSCSPAARPRPLPSTADGRGSETRRGQRESTRPRYQKSSSSRSDSHVRPSLPTTSSGPGAIAAGSWFTSFSLCPGFCGRSLCGPVPLRAGPSVGGPSEGGPSVGGHSEGGPSVGGHSEGGPSVGGPSEGGPSVGGPSEGGPSVGGPSVGGPSVGGPSEARSLCGRSLCGRTESREGKFSSLTNQRRLRPDPFDCESRKYIRDRSVSNCLWKLEYNSFYKVLTQDSLFFPESK